MEEINYLVPQEGSRPSIVLAAHLRSLPPNVIQAYIESYTSPGGLVLDPFCQNDALATEALRLGRKVIVSDFNPITTFVARTSFSDITSQQLSYAFIRLSEGAKLDTSLRVHLSQLYATRCARCQRPTVASSFTWGRDDNCPIKKHYLCAVCMPADGSYHLSTEAVDDADLKLAGEVEAKGFHYWYLSERLDAEASGHQLLANQLLELYTPRNLYALVTILMQIESLFEGLQQQQDILKLALLDCLDSCSKLNAVTKNGQLWKRKGDLRPPARFIERNVWEALDEAFKRISERIEKRRGEANEARFASGAEQLLSSASYSQQQQLPNIFIKRQAARALIDEIPENSVALAITEPPRPERSAFLALSYLWSTWLFGREQASVFDGVRKVRNKVEWDTYFKGMSASFRALRHVLRNDGLLVLHFDSFDFEQCSSLVFAAVAAGLQVKRIIYQPFSDSEDASKEPSSCAPGRYCVQIGKLYHLTSTQRAKPGLAEQFRSKETAWRDLLEQSVKSSVGQAIRDVLTQRAEPSTRNRLIVAVYERLGKDSLFSEAARTASGDEGAIKVLHQVVDAEVQRALESDYRRIPSDEDGSGSWWFIRRNLSSTPVTEQVEKAIYNVLSTSQSVSEQNLARVVYSLFPGALTPEGCWIDQILKSYAVKDAGGSWVLRPEDNLHKRQQQHAQIIAALAQVGHLLGYKVWIGRDQQKQPVVLPMPQTEPSLQGGKHPVLPQVSLVAQGGKSLLLQDLLTPAEWSIGPAALLGGTRAGLIDVIWYERAMPTHIFEVEWTAMHSEGVFSRSVDGKDVRRYLVVPEERKELIQFKLRKSSWFRWAVADEGWDFIKYQHLMRFLDHEKELGLFSFGKIVGLEPVAERDTAQLRMF